MSIRFVPESKFPIVDITPIMTGGNVPASNHASVAADSAKAGSAAWHGVAASENTYWIPSAGAVSNCAWYLDLSYNINYRYFRIDGFHFKVLSAVPIGSVTLYVALNSGSYSQIYTVSTSDLYFSAGAEIGTWFNNDEYDQPRFNKIKIVTSLSGTSGLSFGFAGRRDYNAEISDSEKLIKVLDILEGYLPHGLEFSSSGDSEKIDYIHSEIDSLLSYIQNP